MGDKTDESKYSRCLDWLQKQNSQEPKKLSLQNKNDIQFIIQTNAERKKFLISAAEDEASVPAGVDEPEMKPQPVPLNKLRLKCLRMECEWQSCKWSFQDYDMFQKHIRDHISDLHVTKDGDSNNYVCLWDVCGHKTSEFNEMVRHMNYHAYHSHLLAIGFNGRATLKLQRCTKDSSKRNQLPTLKTDHCCMWTGCKDKFNSIQAFFDHVKQHLYYSEKIICSWAGCGATFTRRSLLTLHMRSHTGESLIACYHCGLHFSCNSTLANHLRRQNVNPYSSYKCSVCGNAYATDYLVREHARQHINAYACSLCDMSAPTPATLAMHVRYRHFASDARHHACPHCPYRAITKSDLRKHIPTHNRKKEERKKKKKRRAPLRRRDGCSDKSSDEENSEEEVPKKNISTKKYACHMCPKKQMKIFSRGTRLTTHLVKVHGAQWPFGHSRFRYQISDDGMYRLTTTRYEFLDVSRKIVDGYSGPKEPITNSYEFNLVLTAEPTETTPRRLEIKLKNSENDEIVKKNEVPETAVEITMCDVDEEGNIINSEVINSDVVFT